MHQCKNKYEIERKNYNVKRKLIVPVQYIVEWGNFLIEKKKIKRIEGVLFGKVLLNWIRKHIQLNRYLFLELRYIFELFFLSFII